MSAGLIPLRTQAPALHCCHARYDTVPRHCSRPSPRGSRQPAAGVSGSQTETETQTQLVLRFGAKVIPHPAKESYGGEDAYFTSPVGGGALGVSDGVSSWSQQGVNPADYSRTLMHLACAFLEGKSVHPVGPKDLINGTVPDMPPSESQQPDMSMDETLPEEAAESSAADANSVMGALAAAHAGTRLPGSATACILRLDRSRNMLTAANLGDSGFLVARNGSPVFQTTPEQHFWDCPFQLAAHPDFASATDHAQDADMVELDVQPGDIVVAGSDGLWDNLHVAEILDLLPQSPEQAEQAAVQMAEAASRHAGDPEYDSPYMQLARQQGLDLPWWQKVQKASFVDGKFSMGGLKGGKLDDITVLIAIVESQAAPSLPPSSSSNGSTATAEPREDGASETSTESAATASR